MARTDRRTAHYSDGLRLARLLLTSEARTIEKGSGDAWSFLIPTAGPVEEGDPRDPKRCAQAKRSRFQSRQTALAEPPDHQSRFGV